MSAYRPVERQQLVVPSPLDDASGVEDEDLVRVHDGRQAVRDAERRAPAGESSRRLCWISRSVAESSAEVASSSTRTDGSFSTVRAIATRCFSPPESLSPRSPTTVWYPSGVETMKSWMRASRAARSISAGVASGRP